MFGSLKQSIKQNVIYKTKIKEIGKDAKGFKAVKMVILFGSEAPDALRSSCYIINVSPLKGKIKAGMLLKMGKQTYKITAVGDKVNKNLSKLGHIAINFTGNKRAKLPGSLYVEDLNYPEINVGNKIVISQK